MDVQGHMGGFCWLWKYSLEVTPLQSSHHWLHIRVQQVDKSMYFITGVYGPSHTFDRNKLWNFLLEVSQTMNSPWLILGDFSQLHFAEEKYSKG